MTFNKITWAFVVCIDIVYQVEKIISLSTVPGCVRENIQWPSKTK